MASAVLKIQSDTARRSLYYAENREEAKRHIARVMTFARNSPPPQLPQIPVDVWANLWDRLVDVLAEDFAKAAKLRSKMGFPNPFTIFRRMDKMRAYAAARSERWHKLVSSAQHLLSSFGVGVSIEEESHISGGDDTSVRMQKVQVGLRLDGVAAPSHGRVFPEPQTLTEKLKELERLKNDGLLTHQEFSEQRARILAGA